MSEYLDLGCLFPIFFASYLPS